MENLWKTPGCSSHWFFTGVPSTKTHKLTEAVGLLAPHGVIRE